MAISVIVGADLTICVITLFVVWGLFIAALLP